MAEWVIAGSGGAGGTPPEIGKVYEVRHSRKGTFRAKVLGVTGPWADVEIVSGVAKAAMRYNVAEEGGQLRVRDLHTYWVPVTS